MGSEDEYTFEVELAKMPRGWVLFAIGAGQPAMAPPPVHERICQLLRIEAEWKRYVHAVAAKADADELRNQAV